MENFLKYLKEEKQLSESTINSVKRDLKRFLVFTQFKKPTKEKVIEFCKNSISTKSRINQYCKYLGYDFFKEEIKIDADIKNFLNTLDHIPFTINKYASILQRYKHAENQEEFINSYKDGRSRKYVIDIINKYRVYKKQKPI
jgi:site-specific recombinase XerD